MSDLDLPLRDRTYREPEGPHVTICRGRDFTDALEHLESRPDCRALAIVGPLPDGFADGRRLSPLAGRRVLLADGEPARLRDAAAAALDAGAEVEWLRGQRPDFWRLAAWALPVAAVVLAAGTATRMGRNKLLMPAGGVPLVSHVVEAATEGGCHHVVVVYSEAEVRDAVGDAATCVHNPEAASGQASSLRAGLGALGDDMAAALVMLGDQPLVGAMTVETLLKAWRREGARPAMATSYGPGKPWRPPVVLDRSLFPELMQLTGDAGARQVLEKRPELVDTIVSTGRPDDVDTPDDYAKILQLFPTEKRG